MLCGLVVIGLVLGISLWIGWGWPIWYLFIGFVVTVIDWILYWRPLLLRIDRDVMFGMPNPIRVQAVNHTPWTLLLWFTAIPRSALSLVARAKGTWDETLDRLVLMNLLSK